MGVKSKLSTMLNTTPAPFANALPYVTLPYVLLTFHTQSVLDLKYRSAPSFSTQRSSLPCHSERSTPSLPSRTQRPLSPVILNAAQRSEESKIIAHPPFTDLTFLPSLEATRPKFCHPEHSIPSLPSRTQPPPSCHLERSHLHPAIPNAAPSPPCHSERSAAE